MLSLTPPFLVVNGLSVFPDHADPKQWYYLPMGPTIAVRDDGGKPVPVFSLLQFRSLEDKLNGGLLNFDVTLGPSGARLDALLDDTAAKIAQQLSLPEQPRRPVPVPFEDGSVKLVLLDKQSDGEQDSAFVERIIHQSKPSLYGSNQTAFSALLNEQGATLALSCLDGVVAPIGVVYSLQFLALRPAYAVSLHVKWAALKERCDKTFGVSGVFLSSQITELLDKLKDERVIEIKDDIFIPEDEAGKGVIADHDRAVAAVYDMITDALFEATLPQRPPPDGWDRAAGFTREFGQAAVTGGLSVLGTYTYRRNTSVQQLEKMLDVRMSQRTTVRRTIYPQGHLVGIASLIAESGRPVDDFTKRVNLDDPWFKERRVAVVSRADFAAEPKFLSSVAVDLRYGGETTTVLLDASTSTGEARWLGEVQDGKLVSPVDVDITYRLANVEGYTLPDQLKAHLVVDGESAEIRPDDAFRLRGVPIRADDLPWTSWERVTVDLRYQDAASGLSAENSLQLVDGASEFVWTIFMLESSPDVFSYRLTYHGRDRQDVVRDWVETDEIELRVTDPFPAKYELEVLPSVDWNTVNIMLVDLVYTDPANGVRQESSMQFDKDHTGIQYFVADLRDRSLRRVAYRVTTLYADGRNATAAESSTGLKRLLVSPTMPVHQALIIRVDTAVSARAGVAEVLVEVAAPGTETVTGSYSFMPGSMAASHEYDVTGPAGYRYRVTYRHANGLSRTGPWTDGHAPVLDVPGE